MILLSNKKREKQMEKDLLVGSIVYSTVMVHAILMFDITEKR